LARLGGSPFNIATWLYLTPFELNDSKELITQPLKLDLSDNVIEQFQLHTGGHPYLIQWTMADIINRTDSPTLEMFNDAKTKFSRTNSNQLFLWWNELCADDQKLYGSLIKSKIPLSFSDCATILNHVAEENIEGLAAYGLARIIDTNPRMCVANGKIFEDWYTQNTSQIDLENKADTDLKEIVFQGETPFGNVCSLRRLLRSCGTYIWWVDPNFGNRALEEILFVVTERKVKEIRILSRKVMYTEKAKRDFARFKKEVNALGVSTEWRTYENFKIHDRFIMGEKSCFNLPPVNSIFEGSYGMAKSIEMRPPFDTWWIAGTPVIE